MEVVAGIDIGGTNTRYGLTDANGKCLVIYSLPTKTFETPEDFAREISASISHMAQGYDLLGIGIGAPNGNIFSGSIEQPPNLPWKGTTPLAQMMQNHINVPVLLTNDANAAAMGEMLFGNAKNMNDFILITLGTGLGSGIVTNKQLIYGHDGFAAEIGHVIVKENGRKCGCGRCGCLETYASATGLAITAYEWMREGQSSVLKDFKYEIKSSDICDAARKGDKLAMRAFSYTGEILGVALANSVAYTSPQAIFLSGGLTYAKELLFKPTQYHFEKNLMNIYRNKIKLLPSGLEDNHVAILGAASLIWNQRRS